MSDVDRPVPRPRPVGADVEGGEGPTAAESSEPHPHPHPAPDAPPASEADLHPHPHPEPHPRPEPHRHPRPTRSERRRAEALGRSGRTTRRLTRIAALACLLAGLALFVVVRSENPSVAQAHRAARTSAPAIDPRAYLTDAPAAQAFQGAAITEVVAVTQSDYRSLDDTLNAGLSVTTNPFRERFKTALTGAQAAARRAGHDVTQISVEQSGIGEMSDGGRRAKVLVFASVQQSGSDYPSGDQSLQAVLCLTMVKRGDQYLISDLQQGVDAGVPPGTAGLSVAARAARAAVVAQSGRTAVRTVLAVQQASGSTATFLVAAVGTSASQASQGTSRYLVNVALAHDAWAATSLIPVG